MTTLYVKTRNFAANFQRSIFNFFLWNTTNYHLIINLK